MAAAKEISLDAAVMAVLSERASFLHLMNNK